jgi:hypothetical protein
MEAHSLVGFSVRGREEDWAVRCGCGERIELMLIHEAKRWSDLSIDAVRCCE